MAGSIPGDATRVIQNADPAYASWGPRDAFQANDFEIAIQRLQIRSDRFALAKTGAVDTDAATALGF